MTTFNSYNTTRLSDEQVQDALSFCSDSSNNTISFWHMDTRFSGYGHWRVTVDLIINDEHHTFSHTTTDSMAIDDMNDDDTERSNNGYESLFSECVSAKRDEIYEACFPEVEETE